MTGTFTVLTVLKAAVLELLGVPLPVVLAAATAAFAARSFLPPTTYVRALSEGLAWTLIGVFLSNLGLAVISVWTGKESSSTILAGVALLIAGLGQICLPVIAAKLPTAIGRRIDQLGGKNDSNS